MIDKSTRRSLNVCQKRRDSKDIFGRNRLFQVRRPEPSPIQMNQTQSFQIRQNKIIQFYEIAENKLMICQRYEDGEEVSSTANQLEYFRTIINERRP